MVHGILIAASDARGLAAQTFGQLEDYQRDVEGWIEAVDSAAIGVTIFVNEEGLLRGLPFDRRATFLWWFHTPLARGRAGLVGDAVLVGLPDPNGEATNCRSRSLCNSLLRRQQRRLAGSP